MTQRIAQTKSPNMQEVCIDLPGETVQCWHSAENLTVILKKHRDVIFDINLGGGATYTVESSASNFYSVRDKKIILSSRGGKVSFVDGERMHLWVARNFVGELILKCDGKFISKFEPNKIDGGQYDEDPKTKPAPLIVVIGPKKDEGQKKLVAKENNLTTSFAIPPSSAAPIDDGCTMVCVVEGNIKNAPKKILEYFKGGGNKSVLVDIDPDDIATRNWMWGQVVGAAAYVADNWEWLRASIDGKTHKGFKLVSAKVHYVNGKVRFYYSGYSKYNTVFGPGGFGPGNERVMNIFSGVGKTSSAFASMAKGIAGTLKNNALLCFVFTSAISMAEWKSDVNKDGHDLAATLLTGLLKALIATAIVAAIVALIVVAVMIAYGASMTVLMVGALTMVLGAIMGFAIEKADKSLAGTLSGNDPKVNNMADIIAPYLRRATERAKWNWNYLVEKYVFDYKEIVF